MTNAKFLTKVSRLQKEFKELYIKTGLVGISSEYFHIEATLFHELEKKNLLEHISKTLNKKKDQWTCVAMTPDGVKIIALEDIGDVGEKK